MLYITITLLYLLQDLQNALLLNLDTLLLAILKVENSLVSRLFFNFLSKSSAKDILLFRFIDDVEFIKSRQSVSHILTRIDNRAYLPFFFSEVATTIQGSYQLDQFGLGAIGITGPVLAFFGLITYDQFRVRCRAALGMSPHTIATMTFNNQVGTFSVSTLRSWVF